MKKVLKNNKYTKKYLESLPKMYLVACWAKFGVEEFPFTEKFEKDNNNGHLIPLVYQYDDSNGERDCFVLKKITKTTTGSVLLWTQSKSKAERIAELYNSDFLDRNKKFVELPREERKYAIVKFVGQKAKNCPLGVLYYEPCGVDMNGNIQIEFEKHVGKIEIIENNFTSRQDAEKTMKAIKSEKSKD